MKIRVYTCDTYLDIDIKDITQELLLQNLEDGNTVVLTKTDGNIFILNMINVIAIEVIPPINN